MTKRELNSIKKFVEQSADAIRTGGYYMPSDAQTNALKALVATVSNHPSNRDYTRLANLIMEIDSANLNGAYAVCATPAQLETIKRLTA